jgi:hypothetical protein
MDSSALSFPWANNTPLGIYPITVTASGGGILHPATVALTVGSDQAAGFASDAEVGTWVASSSRPV